MSSSKSTGLIKTAYRYSNSELRQILQNKPNKAGEEAFTKMVVKSVANSKSRTDTFIDFLDPIIDPDGAASRSKADASSFRPPAQTSKLLTQLQSALQHNSERRGELRAKITNALSVYVAQDATLAQASGSAQGATSAQASSSVQDATSAQESSSAQASTSIPANVPDKVARKVKKRETKIEALKENSRQIHAVKEAVASTEVSNMITGGKGSQELHRRRHNAYVKAAETVFNTATSKSPAYNATELPPKEPAANSIYRFHPASRTSVISLYYLKLNLENRQAFSIQSSPAAMEKALSHTNDVFGKMMENWDRYSFAENLDGFFKREEGRDPSPFELLRIALALVRTNEDPQIVAQVDNLLKSVIDGCGGNRTTLGMLSDPDNFACLDNFADRHNPATTEPEKRLAVLKLKLSMLQVQKLLLECIKSNKAKLEAQAAQEALEAQAEQAAQDAEASTSSADAAAQQPPTSSSDSAAATSSRAERRERGRDRERRAQQTGTDAASTAGSTSRGRSTTRRSASESAARSRSHSRHKERFYKIFSFGLYNRSKSADVSKSRDIEISKPKDFVHTGSGSADRAVDEAQATTTPPASTSRAGRTERRTDRRAQDSGDTGSSTRSRLQPRTSTGGGQDAAASTDTTRRGSSSTSTLRWPERTGNAPGDDTPPVLPPRLPIATTQTSPTDAPVNESSAASSTTAPQPRTRTVFPVNMTQGANGSVQTGDDEEIYMEDVD